MRELEYIKQFFKKQFDKYENLELGFKYEYNSITLTHIIEVSNEDIFKSDDFNNEAFDFAINFSNIYNELLMFIKPNDPIRISCVDYSENNFDKKNGYILVSKNLKSLISSIVIENVEDVNYFQGASSAGVNATPVAVCNANVNSYALAA
jgi:hypothetical protein